MAEFYPAVAFVLSNEGALTDDKRDMGEITNHGISLRFYRATVKPDANDADIRNLSVAEAEAIYKAQFWGKSRYGELNSQLIATKMLDLAVNLGAHEANLCLQRAINNCCTPAITLDGIIGVKTIDCANILDENVLYGYLIVEAGKVYQEILIAHPQDKPFAAGWNKRLNKEPV